MRKLTGLLFLFLLTGIGVIAQTYSFQHIGVEDGLAQSVVTSLAQDDNGVIWIGTMSGLNRYDGDEFKVIGKDDGLAENWITASLRDKNGNVWFGHWGGGVTFYDIESGKFTDMKFERFSRFKSITGIIDDQNGDIWFATNGGGAFKYESQKDEIVSLTKEDGFLSNNLTSICLDQNNNLWFGTNKGVIVYESTKPLEDNKAFILLTKEEGLISDQVTSIEKIGDNVFIGTEFNGISIVGNLSDLNHLSFKNLNMSNGLSSDQISYLYAVNKEIIWIGTKDNGAFRYNTVSHEKKSLSTRQGLNYFKVNCIFKGREDNIWIGTDLGLNLFRGDQFLMYDESDGIVNNVVWSIIEDNKQRIWMGTNDGLSRVSFNENEVKGSADHMNVVNFTKQDGLSNNVVLSLLCDESDRIWCGTSYGGITIMSDAGTKIKVLDSTNGLVSNTIYSICRDLDGYFWAGTNKGVSRISKEYQIENFTVNEGLGGNNIYKVYCDKKGVIWFAAIGGDLSKFENGAFHRFESDNKSSRKFITSIAEDAEGLLWFGGYGGGIYKYDGKEFTNYNTSNGLSSNSPYSLIADNAGHLWIGTNKGIDKFDLAALNTKSFHEKEGFMGVEPNPNSVCKDHNGNLWFGTIMGAVKFDLSQEKKNMAEPITILESLKIDYEPFEFPENNEFDYDENHITFHYIGISLTNPDHVEYKYMLDGFDRDWSPGTKDQDVVYSNLSPGKYEFKVMASNNDGLWNQLPTTYAFVINPPFWRTWWFYTLCVIFVVAAVYSGDKIRMRKIMADKAILEQKVDERTAEVVEQKKLVEEKNVEILDSIKYAKRIQEAILPPVSEVKKYLKESFILYKPKDIVAGDFYWFETKGDYIYIAAADCTGHGVPGAMVSVVCANALNRAVNEMNILEPAAILDKTRELVVATFEKSERQVQDGMDISFCRLDLKKRKLLYTGAHNPVYRITPISDELDDKILRTDTHMLLEYKGDKQPIGKFAYERPFTQQEIDLKEGDVLYLSTDGFADQFGGESEKKFMYKAFKNMFLSMQDITLDKQVTEIDQIFESWKGSFTQIDDVCVIGLKI